MTWNVFALVLISLTNLVTAAPSIVFTGTAATVGQYPMTNVANNSQSYIAIPGVVNTGPQFDIDATTGRIAGTYPVLSAQACIALCDANPVCPGVLVKPANNNFCYGRQLYTNISSVPLNNQTVNILSSPSTLVTYLKVPFFGIINNCADLATYQVGAAFCKDYPASVPASYQTALAPIKFFDSSGLLTYNGCYTTVDSISNSRTLSLNATSMLASVTPTTCSTTCRGLYFPYSATEFGKYCYCGQLPVAASQGIDSLCSYSCSGNSSISCGGNGYTDVYYQPLPTAFVDTQTAVNVVYRGCFSDFAASRTLPVSLSVPNLTPANCVAACAAAGYVMAGLEYGAECYCHILGNTFPITVSSVDLATSAFFATGGGAANYVPFGTSNACVMKCAGDATKICGGSNFMNIYTWTAANTAVPNIMALDPSNNPTGLTTKFIGCAVDDDDSNRVLANQAVLNTTLLGVNGLVAPMLNSPNNCRDTCYQLFQFNATGVTGGLGGAGYFGVINGGECWCGLGLQKTPTFRSYRECSIACPDNSGKFCGAARRLQLYQYTTPNIAASIIYNASNVATYVGCFADSGTSVSSFSQVNGNGRVLSGIGRNWSGMRFDYCVTMCRRNRYTYMGLSNAQMCYCDNAVRTSSSLGPGTCSTGVKTETFYAAGNATSMAIWQIVQLPWLKAVEPGTFDTPYSSGAWNYGCADDSSTSRILPFRANLGSTLVTPKACVSSCAYSGYTYSGVEFGTECWCGNTGYSNYNYVNNQICSTMGCAGNSSQQCGGPNIMSVYFNGQLNATSGIAGIVTSSNSYTLQGCASDLYPVSRVLQTVLPLNAANLTVDICTAACAARGFPYAALEYGSECYCDAKFTAAFLATNQACITPCRGDTSKFCGGPNSLAVYFNAASAQLGIVSNFTDFKGQTVSFYGCFSDNSASVATRTFQNRLNIPAPGTMTPQTCIQLCTNSGYAYAGLEYGLECWCSNAAPATSLQLSVDSCSMKCAGASNLLCGNGNVLSVYYSAKAGSASTVGSSGAGNLLGCFADTATDPSQSYSNGASLAVSGGRVLAGTRIDLGMSNTVELCIATCSTYGYTLAGVSNGSSCFCDSTQRSSTASSQCTTPCAGDSTELCGGSAAVQVYTTNTATAPIVGSIFSTSLTTASFYMGCAIDSTTNRVLPTGPNVAIAASNTPQTCLDTCTQLGYVYAGVEYGSECWCGSVAPTLLPLSRQAECAGKTCSGNSAVACGAGNRIAVYSNGNVAAAVTYMPGSGSYQLLGCAADSISSRTLSKPIILNGAMTVPACLAACAAGNFYYAGVEYASECYCGNFFTSSKILATNATCNMPCAGAANTYCGGANAINIYQNPSITRGNVATYTSGVMTWKYMSCWGEPGGGRAFAIQLNNPSRTVQSCLTLGTQGGYTACGLEYGGECWCSQTAQPSAGGQISEAYCSTTAANVQYGMTCAGDSTQWCGSGNVLSWYGTGTQSYTLFYSYP